MMGSLSLERYFVNQSGHTTDMMIGLDNGLVLCFGASPLNNTGTEAI